MLPAGIEKLPIKEWTNKHENFTHTLVEGASFKLFNPEGIQFSTRRDRYLASTKNFQWLIKRAKSKNYKMRAMGSGWSFTKVGVTDGGIIDTCSLNFSFPVTQDYVSSNYANTAEDLYFLQCGCIMYEVNNRLAAKIPQRSLKASGASNGQTIAGALSTGTHGAGINAGAIPDFVTGLHLITGDNKHIWLEKASYPVASQKFVDWLQADLVRNDDWFNAALVSFGSFGFIHGVMVETAPIFLLEEHRLEKIPYDDTLKKVMTTLDFRGFNLPGAASHKELYHFEVLVNPHNFQPNDSEKGVFVKFMYKKPLAPYTKIPKNVDFAYGDDLLGVISKVLDLLGSASFALIPGLVNSMFKMAYKAQPPQEGVVGEIFNYTKFRGKIASAAMGMDIKDSPKILETIVSINKQFPIPGGVSLRFLKGTSATLGFTKYSKTCVLEMDGMDSATMNNFCEKVWKKLEEENLQFTLHWGKINFILDEKRLQNMYGKPKVESWISARNSLLDTDCKKIFSNTFLKQCGLDKDLGPII